jgi:hypothetical protein
MDNWQLLACKNSGKTATECCWKEQTKGADD